MIARKDEGNLVMISQAKSISLDKKPVSDLRCKERRKIDFLSLSLYLLSFSFLSVVYFTNILEAAFALTKKITKPNCN